ncbi:uncharacterized protein LOC120311329 [Crotalus tigris]|uniref:uncharacterized protein LOC120311329 n=1 Tax=Crotalus tigris TaxID=88082 RepID=UPI00192F5810|nr:uncharacterized protein LOC120311329 [Crotalus tigris]
MEGDTGFKGIKLFCDLQKVQDAVPKIHISQHQEGRLSLFNRPHRGVSAYSHPSSVSQVPQVLLRAPALPIQGPTIRPVLSPKSLHEDFSGHSSLPQAEAGARAMLPGRYPSPVQLFSGSKTGCSNYDTHSAESRVLCELQEEPHHSNKEINTPGSDNRLVPLQGISFSGEADQHQETCSSGSQGQESASGTAVKAPRKDDLLPWARLHSRLLQWFFLPYQKRNLSASNRKVTVPHHTLRSLFWWTTSAMTKGVIFREPNRVILTTDASLFGWGAHLGTHLTQGQWSHSDLAQNINWLELRAIHLALLQFSSLVKGKHVLVRTDNVAAKAHLVPPSTKKEVPGPGT